ncbi:restriction endonuclease [Rhodopseudomonas palustris]|uniref:restriction endonuclease n=1 Tax=Rhodopseudomonas palustris TaxID=1076 RepID=UPI0020CD78DA|nr:restriction endonuclease [Rhodopseudomonas palustris]
MRLRTGVREMSRLISRLRHRQFGILVTTSFVDSQAYREIKEDQHPIVVVSAIDIVDILRSHGYGDADAVRRWLVAQF